MSDHSTGLGNRPVQATGNRDRVTVTHGRTDGRTNEEIGTEPINRSPNATRAGGQTRIPVEPAPSGALLNELMGLMAVDRNERLPVTRREGRQPVIKYVRVAVLHRDRWRCQWCGNRASEGHVLEVDHVVPWSAGGSDKSDNLRALCAGCNQDRGNRRADMDMVAPLPIVCWCPQCLDPDLEPLTDGFAVYCEVGRHLSIERDRRWVI